MYMNKSLFTDFLADREILWTGINFSMAKFTKNGFDFPQEILQHYFHDWNMLILNDQKKYDIRMSFRKPIMQYNLSAVTKINKNIRINNILTSRIDLKDTLTEEKIFNNLPAMNPSTPWQKWRLSGWSSTPPTQTRLRSASNI